MAHSKRKYFVIEGEPTSEQYALVPETPSTVARNASGSKCMLKYDGEGIPEAFLGLAVYSHLQILRITQDSEWLE